jgi:predicted RNase H-like HicB family nuclease
MGQARNTRRVQVKSYIFTVVVEPDEDTFHASCPALKGCFSWGRTKAEALKNIQKVARLWVEAKLEAGERIPVEHVRVRQGLAIATTEPTVTITV